MNSFYIIFSKSLNKYYSGITHDNVEVRLNKHNTSFYGKGYTSTAKDWELKLTIDCDTFSQARRMELYVKRMKSRKFIEKLIEYPEEVAKLLEITNQSS